MKLLIAFMFCSFCTFKIYGQSKNQQNLGLPLTCFEPGGIFHYFVDADDCKTAAKRMLFTDRDFLDPAEWLIRNRNPRIRNLLLTTKFRSCPIAVDSEEPLSWCHFQ